jgi:hypothetical protein
MNPIGLKPYEVSVIIHGLHKVKNHYVCEGKTFEYLHH